MVKRTGIVAGLALSDLLHEWILSLCLILGFAAVIAPLLLLMGLKFGTISTLRQELVEDPIYREIRPAKTREYPPTWFDTVARRPEVEFITPSILAASSIITVMDPVSGGTKIFDLIPTGSGDPLLLENGGRIPNENQCVLTGVAADELGVSAGDFLKVRATRSKSGRRQFGEADLEIAAVLDDRAGALPRVYAPLSFVLDVESFKEGLGIPSRRWIGGSLRPYYSFDGIFVVIKQVLAPVAENSLIINTGLTSIDRIDGDAFRLKMGFVLPKHLYVYELRASQTTIHYSSIDVLKNKLRGQGAVLLPFVDTVELHIAEGKNISTCGLSLSPRELKMLRFPPLPWGRMEKKPLNQKLRQILLPKGMKERKTIITEADVRGGTLSFPMMVKDVSFSDRAIVPAELMGILRTANQRKVTYDNVREDFLLSRSGFRGFRLYTRTIDDVVALAKELKKQDIDVIAQIESIERVRILDRGLTNIFWLVAVVGITGGIAALIASLYAAVERKTDALSVMRLIGLSRANVFMFPVCQGAGLALMSMIVATSAYVTLAAVINRVFSNDLDIGDRICRLPPSYLGIAMISTITVALLSSLLAAWRTTRIDPAEGLRYE